ncbi:MAG: flavin reductase [Oscillospiraceae bacterium]|nr:flavin reductase [Oscillospiraceae bacterium]
MHCCRPVTEDLYWVGGNDRRIPLFENVFPVPRGVSYNSYLLLDEQTVLFDTVDKAVRDVFWENVAHLLDGRGLDWLVIHHMEPDHCSAVAELILRYPSVRILCSDKARVMLGQFFPGDLSGRVTAVKEGDSVCFGRHTLTFVMAPMVHWPEVMVSYDAADKLLFSADAFGTFGALGGSLFADEVDFAADWLPDARRYYANIVGKYGTQVQSLLKKAAGLDIEMICPLHGPVWRRDIGWFLDKYRKWSAYEPEDHAVMIAYASVYGHTENAAAVLAALLADAGVRNTVLYDVSVTHPSQIVAEAFRCSHLVFASTTYNAGIFCNMETVLTDLAAHNLQNRSVALIENGSWAPTSGELMRGILSMRKNIRFLGDKVTLRSAPKEDQRESLRALAGAIAADMPAGKPPVAEKTSDPNAFFRLSYGLYVLTARENGFDNGCVINTAVQVTDSPKRISIAVNKANLTHDMILRTGRFNLSVLSTETPFKVFQHFGYQSGRTADKFAGCPDAPRAENGLIYLPHYANAFFSGRVVATADFGSHTVFTAEIEEARVLSEVPSATYSYYFEHIKPRPQPPEPTVKGYVCKICGYVYEGETLPEDFVCPLCKHGAADFEKIS